MSKISQDKSQRSQCVHKNILTFLIKWIWSALPVNFIAIYTGTFVNKTKIIGSMFYKTLFQFLMFNSTCHLLFLYRYVWNLLAIFEYKLKILHQIVVSIYSYLMTTSDSFGSLFLTPILCIQILIPDLLLMIHQIILILWTFSSSASIHLVHQPPSHRDMFSIQSFIQKKKIKSWPNFIVISCFTQKHVTLRKSNVLWTPLSPEQP